AMRIVMAISMLAFITMAFSRAKASSERIDFVLNEAMEEIPTDHTYGNPKGRHITKGALRFDDVSFQYPASEVAILQHISFSTEAHRTLAVIGSTGSGKTTMFQLIPRLYEPSSGQIYIDDLPITA